MNGLTKSKGSTSGKKDSGTMLTEQAPKPSSTGSDGPFTLDTKQGSEVELIDDAFFVRKQKWGTYVSYSLEEKELITSLTEETCIVATRCYLKWQQDGFTEGATTYDGTVGGKL